MEMSSFCSDKYRKFQISMVALVDTSIMRHFVMSACVLAVGVYKLEIKVKLRQHETTVCFAVPRLARPQT